MTDAALLAAIVAEPDDDTPRLVYADWLDEHDRPEEAAFLRAQCALAASGPDHPDYAELIARERELIEWLGTHSPGPPVKLPGGLQFHSGQGWWNTARRGFPRFVTYESNGRGSASAVRPLGPALERAFEVVPTRWVVLRDITLPQLAEALTLPVFERVTGMTLQIRAGEEEANEAARIVAAAPRLKNLRDTTLWFPFGDTGAAALAASAHLGNLESFATDAANLTADGIRALLGAEWFHRLRVLDFENGLADGVLEALSAAPPCPRLHTFDLSRCGMSVEAWQAFARSASFPRLAKLVLEGGNMSQGRLAALARAKNFALRELDLSQCAIGNDGAEALAAAPWLGSLRVLNLTANRLGPSGVKAVCNSPRLCELRHLDLRHNSLGAGGLRAIAGNPALRGLIALDLGHQYAADKLTTAHLREFLDALDAPDLRHLELKGLPVGVKGAKRIASSPKFGKLTRLGLSACGVGDSGAAAVIASPHLQGLIELNLSENNLTTGLKALTDPSVLPRLATCDVSRNHLTADLAEKLHARRRLTT